MLSLKAVEPEDLKHTHSLNRLYAGHCVLHTGLWGSSHEWKLDLQAGAQRESSGHPEQKKATL